MLVEAERSSVLLEVKRLPGGKESTGWTEKPLRPKLTGPGSACVDVTAAECESVLEQIEASQFCPESTADVDKWDHGVGSINAHMDSDILKMFLRATNRTNCKKRNEMNGMKMDGVPTAGFKMLISHK